MTTTYKSAQVQSAQVRFNLRGSDFTVLGTVAPLTAAVGDIYQLVQVPNGYTIVDMLLDTDQLDSNGAPTLSLEVGDSGNAARFYTGTTIARTGGVAIPNVNGFLGFTYTVGTNQGQFSGGQAGATIIQAQVTAAAATFKAGTVRLAVRMMQMTEVSNQFL